jgi:hypothetical protein
VHVWICVHLHYVYVHAWVCGCNVGRRIGGKARCEAMQESVSATPKKDHRT